MPTPSPRTPEPYRMPTPPVGAVVWRHTPDSEPFPAVVTSAGRSAVSVMVFPPDSRGGLPKAGVLHASDPRLRGHTPDADAGCWDFTDETKLLRSLAEQLGAK